MRRGTTPTHRYTIPDELDPLMWNKIYITYGQFKRPIVEKTISDITIDGQKLIVDLSQADTLLFKEGEAQSQIRASTNSGKKYASNKFIIKVEDVIKKGEI